MTQLRPSVRQQLDSEVTLSTANGIWHERVCYSEAYLKLTFVYHAVNLLLLERLP